MQIRSGFSYPKPEIEKRKASKEAPSRRKRNRVAAASGDGFFSWLADDIVVSILCRLSSSACCPSDLINVLLTCKRLNGLALDPLVLSKASLKLMMIRARNWSEHAHEFLKCCINAGSLEALYILGMIKFYCLQSRSGGASLMAKAAIKSHPIAMYSLAVIQFNGSGGQRKDKDLRAGAALLARSAQLGHNDAIHEFGHCLQDGYGVRKNVPQGRCFLLQAAAMELKATCSSPHPANQFLIEWFKSNPIGPDLRLCSHGGCGRPETRKHEFRRCSVCGKANYCSRACQALHWKATHKMECAPMEQEQQNADEAEAEEVGDGDEAMVENAGVV